MKKYAVLIGLGFFLILVVSIIYFFNARMNKIRAGASVSPVVVDVLPQIATYTKPSISKKDIEDAKRLGKEGKAAEVIVDENGKEISRKETKVR
jgi:hypothetical protein